MTPNDFTVFSEQVQNAKKQFTLGVPLSVEKGRDAHFTQTVAPDFVALCCRNGPRIIPGSCSGARLGADAG